MTKERVAIFLEAPKNSGGAFQELDYMVKKIKKFNKNEIEIVIISTSSKLELNLEEEKLETYYFSMNAVDRLICFLRNYGPITRRIKKFFFFNNKFEKFLKKIKIDLVYFTGPSQYSLYLDDTDFIITVPDVSHRENIELPEWTKSSEFVRKDEILKKTTIKAVAVITNSEIIKNRISFIYSVLKERIFVINHQPSTCVSTFDKNNKETKIDFDKKYKLPKKYLFYPAMYLPHKNHRYLLDVIKILNYDLKIDMSLVLCGSDKGYLDRLKKHALKLKIDTKVIFLNFVDGDHLPYLYLNAFALAMPTYSGPTNIPPWEAFHLGTPVLYSDIFEIKKIYKDAVYYVDPYDPLTMVEGIKKMLQNDLISQELIHNGKKLLNSINSDKEFGQFFDIIRKRKKLKESWVFEK